MSEGTHELCLLTIRDRDGRPLSYAYGIAVPTSWPLLLASRRAAEEYVVQTAHALIVSDINFVKNNPERFPRPQRTARIFERTLATIKSPRDAHERFLEAEKMLHSIHWQVDIVVRQEEF